MSGSSEEAAEMGTNTGGSWDPGGSLPTPADPRSMDQFKNDGTLMMIMEGTNDKLKEERPRDVYINLEKVIKNIIMCKRIKSGDYLMKVPSIQKDDILNIKSIGTIPVKFNEAWNLNQTKVTIMDDDIKQYNNDELTLDLKAKNNEVVDVEIQKTWEKGELVNSEYAIITLQGKFSEMELKDKRLTLHFAKLRVKLLHPTP